MRTRELKINGHPVEAVLMAGGQGFKIYSIGDGVAVVQARKTTVYKEDDPDFKIVMRYVNLRYQPAGDQEKVKAEFNALINPVDESADDDAPDRYKDAIDKVEKKLYSRMRKGKIKSKLGKKGKSKIPGFGYFFKRD